MPASSSMFLQSASEDGVPLDGEVDANMKFRLLPVLILSMIAAEKFHRWRSNANNAKDEGTTVPWKESAGSVVEFAAALALFCLSGPGLIVLNKNIYTDLGFSFPMSVSNLGNIFLVIVTRGGARLGFFSLKKSVLPWGLFLTNVVPLSMCGSLSIVVGNVVYLYISLPLIQILKTGTLVLVMIFGFALGVEHFRWGLVCSIIIMVAGISVALQSGYDASDEGSSGFAVGIAIMIFGNVMEAMRAVMLQVSVEKLDFTDSLYWCSPTMAIVGLVLSVPMEFQQIAQAEFNPTLLVALAGSGVLGGCVSFSTFWITKLVGGLSVKVLVNARNIGLILYSVVILGEKCSANEYVGYSLALVGIALYDRVRQGPAPSATVAAAEESSATKSLPTNTHWNKLVAMEDGADADKQELTTHRRHH